MNIQELARQAIERIDSMSAEELRAKFLEHGYVPANQNSHSCYSSAQHVDFTDAVKYLPKHEIPANQANYFNRNNCDFDIAA